MTQRSFHPPLAATIMSLLIFVVLVGLGTWQLKRLEWKTALIADIRLRMEKPPVPLPEVLDDPAAWEYRRVTLAGHFLYDHEFLIKPRTLEGINGAHMLVPFERLSGGIVFVNRGWISDEMMNKAARPKGTIQIEGIIQQPHTTYFTPANVPQTNAWYWPDVDAMAYAAGFKSAAPVTITIARREAGVYPVGGTLTLDIPNNHRQYAIFWFLMAIVSQVIFILRFRKT